MKSKLMKGLVIVALVGSLTACEMDRQQRHTATGAAIGGVAGGLLGGDILCHRSLRLYSLDYRLRHLMLRRRVLWQYDPPNKPPATPPD